MKRLIKTILLSLALLSGALTGCAGTTMPKEMPEISVKYMDEAIEYKNAINQWNGMAVKRLPLLSEAALAQDYRNRVILDQGAEINIDFGKYPPEEISVTRSEFRQADNEEPVLKEMITIQLGKKSGSNYLIHFDQVDAAGETVLMGYSITCYWGENICEYAFVAEQSK